MKTCKKIMALILALTMCLALAACGGSAPKEEAPKEDTAAAEPAAEESTEEAAEEAPVEEAAPAEGETFKISVIQLVQHPALDAATQGFVDKVVELGLVASADDVNIQNAQGDSSTCSTIVNGFVQDGTQLMLANATPALQAAAAATADIPILGTSVTDYATALDIADWTGTTGMNISGTSDLAPLDQQAAMLNELFPVESYPNVGILYCSAEANSKYQADVVVPILEGMGYKVTTYTFSDTNDVASVTTTACGECNVLYVPTDNMAASCAGAINDVALPAGVPIVAGEEGICSGCGVATLSIDYYDIGAVAGEMAYDILVNGADISTMEIKTAPQVTKKYNKDNCEALNITVPDDYVAIESAE